METDRPHAPDATHASGSPGAVWLRLFGVRGEEPSSAVSDRCLGLALGTMLVVLTCVGPQSVVRAQLRQMARSSEGLPITSLCFGALAFVLLSLALVLLAVSGLRACASRAARCDLGAAAMMPSLRAVACLASLGLNLGAVQDEMRALALAGWQPPGFRAITVLCAASAAAAASSLLWFVYRVWTGQASGEARGARERQPSAELSDPIAPMELGDARAPPPARAGAAPKRTCCGPSSCCCCGCSVVVVLVAASLAGWVDLGIGSGDPGEPISAALWENMNHRDLVFAEMSMNLVQRLGADWGANPAGIANPSAYAYRPQQAPEPYPNRYISSILEMSLVAHDQYTFPGEIPYPSPRWSVVRIKRRAGHGGDVLVVAFRGSAGDPDTALDWNTFDALNEQSAVLQDDGLRFTRGFFDESLCVFMEQGLAAALRGEQAAGVAEVFTTGHSLGGAWASILMTRLAPGKRMACPDGREYASPFGELSAQAVTFGKPAPFYVPDGRMPQAITGLAGRETDYVYHGDFIARGNHDAVRYCGRACWAALALSGQPCFKVGHTSDIQYHYHGDTTTIWILNEMTGSRAPSITHMYPVASRKQVGVYFREVDRSQGINMGFIIGPFLPFVLAAAGEEHGNAYAYILWYYDPDEGSA